MLSNSLCAWVCDFRVSNRISSSSSSTAASTQAWLCLSWARMALVCAIDQPSQLQSTLPSEDQQEEEQAAGLGLSLPSGNTISSSSIIVCAVSALRCVCTLLQCHLLITKTLLVCQFLEGQTITQCTVFYFFWMTCFSLIWYLIWNWISYSSCSRNI